MLLPAQPHEPGADDWGHFQVEALVAFLGSDLLTPTLALLGGEEAEVVERHLGGAVGQDGLTLAAIVEHRSQCFVPGDQLPECRGQRIPVEIATQSEHAGFDEAA